MSKRQHTHSQEAPNEVCLLCWQSHPAELSTARERMLRTPFWSAAGWQGTYQPARSTGMLSFRTRKTESISASGIGSSTIPAGALVCCRDLETGGCN